MLLFQERNQDRRLDVVWIGLFPEELVDEAENVLPRVRGLERPQVTVVLRSRRVAQHAQAIQQNGTHEQAILARQDVIRKRDRAAGKGSGQRVVVVGLMPESERPRIGALHEDIRRP